MADFEGSKIDIDLSPGMSVYKVLEGIEHEMKTILADLMDNSVDSFCDMYNVEDLKCLPESKKPFVKIAFTSETRKITIQDNAGGMNEEDFKKAMRLGLEEVVHPRGRLSRYGAGMKIAAKILSDSWSVETSSDKTDYKIRVEIDYTETVDKHIDKIEADKTSEAVERHYTKVTINKCKKYLFPNKKDLEETVLPHLIETFLQFPWLRIEVRYDGEEIEISEKRRKYMMLEYSPLEIEWEGEDSEKPNDEKVIWKKDIEFSYDMESGEQVKISGFVVILKENLSSGKQPGIRLTYNKRVISGISTFPNYRLREVLAERTGSSFLPYKIYGILDVEGIEPNVQKTNFQGIGYQFYQKIREKIESGTLNFIQQILGIQKKEKKKRKEEKEKKEEEKEKKARDRENWSKGSHHDKLLELLKTFPEEAWVKKEEKEEIAQKIINVYETLCTISFKEHGELAAVGTQIFLENLAILAGKTDSAKVKDYMVNFLNDRQGKSSHIRNEQIKGKIINEIESNYIKLPEDIKHNGKIHLGQKQGGHSKALVPYKSYVEPAFLDLVERMVEEKKSFPEYKNASIEKKKKRKK